MNNTIFDADKKILGSSLKNLKEMVKEYAASGDNILFLGKRGTGKELFARLYSEAADKDTFKAINCSGTPDTLLEDKLFGHIQGAYTGADKKTPGLIEEFAEKSVIFFDELGDASDNFQANLLRLVQFGEYEKVGSNVTQKIDPEDLRIIAATSKHDKVRDDLKDRFIPLYILELASRPDDIPGLIKVFCKTSNMKYITEDALEFLLKYKWPGNVRELKRVIEKEAVKLGKARGDNTITINDIPSIKFYMEEQEDKSPKKEIARLPINKNVAPRRYFLRYLTATMPEESAGRVFRGTLLQRLSYLEKIYSTLRRPPRKLSKDAIIETDNILTFDNLSPSVYKELFWEYYAEKGIRPTDLANRFPGEKGMSPKNSSKELLEAKDRLATKDKKRK